MTQVIITKQEDGTFGAAQVEPKLRNIGADGVTEADAIARLFEYHAELVRNGSIRLDELVVSREGK